MTDKDKLAEEILHGNDLFYDYAFGLCTPVKQAIQAMQTYHEAKLRESKIVESFERENQYVTDEDIEKWANSKEKIIDEMPETLKLHITKKIECRIDGAKAFRDGEIVSSNRDDSR